MSVLSIKIGAVLDGSFNTVIKGSSGQLTRLGENIRKLDSSLKSVSKFKQLGSDVLTIVFPKVNDKGIMKYLSYNGI